MRRLRGTEVGEAVGDDVIKLVTDPLRMKVTGLFRPGGMGGSAAPDIPEAEQEELETAYYGAHGMNEKQTTKKPTKRRDYLIDICYGV